MGRVEPWIARPGADGFGGEPLAAVSASDADGDLPDVHLPDTTAVDWRAVLGLAREVRLERRLGAAIQVTIVGFPDHLGVTSDIHFAAIRAMATGSVRTL